MRVEYLAQSSFIIEEGPTRIIIDPWLDNPLSPKNINDLGKIDYVFLTHDHSDHGPRHAVEISKQMDAFLVSPYEFSQSVSADVDQGNIVSCNIGGFFSHNDIAIKVVNATHSSSVGQSVGYMVKINGYTFYHMGDTGYQSDFSWLGKNYDIDLLFVPIGSTYTMDPFEGAIAVGELKPSIVIPMHYNTFDKIRQDPEHFVDLVGRYSSKSKVEILKPGDARELHFPIEKA